MAALICSRRQISVDEYLPVLLAARGDGTKVASLFVDPVWWPGPKNGLAHATSKRNGGASTHLIL